MSQTIDLQAIAAFLSPSLQQNLDMAIAVEIHRLETCLVINLTAAKMLDQAQTVEFIQADLSLFQLVGITVIRVCGWHRFGTEVMPIWSQDLPRMNERSPEPVPAPFISKSNPDLVDYNASSTELPEAEKGIGKKLLPLLFIPVGLGLGALLKLTTSVDFTAPNLPILPAKAILKKQPTPTITFSPSPITVTPNSSISPIPAVRLNPTIVPNPGTSSNLSDPNAIQPPPNLSPSLAPNLAPSVNPGLPGIKNPTANPLLKNDPKSAIKEDLKLDLTKQIISLAQYNQIKPSMTVAEVEKVIGSTGRLIYDSRVGSTSAQIYSWKNPQGSNAIIEFRDGVVATKNQAGL